MLFSKFQIRNLQSVGGFLIFLFSIFYFIDSNVAFATDFSSTNFKVRDPILQIGGGGQMSSTNFRLIGSVAQIAIGTSTTSNFKVLGGFLYFPFASSPVVSATAGNGQVSLSWSASQGVLGWTVSGYNVGKSTISGGPYTYTTSLGNVTSSTRTGLTNGTTYYFIVRAEDYFGNSVATSTEVSATPVAPTPSCGDGTCNGSETCSTCAADCGQCGGGGGIISSGGGGGGGGAIITPSTKVILKGRAYPNAAITIFKDGSVVATPKVNVSANFTEELSVVGGTYTFSLYAISSDNQRSLTSSFTTNVPAGLTTTISDIVIAPTIGVDKSQVKYGNDIKFFGYTYPQSQINVIINSDNPIADKTNSDKFGYWAYDLNSGILERGDHTMKSQTITPDNLKSPFSESVAFKVGDTDVLAGKLTSILKPSLPVAPVCSKRGDINNDGKINIVDFSIMLYFWNQRSPKNPCADINGDGVANLFDFSIMLYWWTG